MGARLSVAQQTRARTHSSLSSSSSGLAVGSTSANGTHLAMGNSTSSGATTSDVRLRSRSVGELVAGGHVAHGGGTQGDSDSSADEITSITAIDRLLRMPNAPHSFTVSTLRYLGERLVKCHTG